MDWMQVDIFTTTAGVEPVGAMLLDMGVAGYAVRDSADFEAFLAGRQGRWDYIDDELMKLRDAETALTVYFARDAQGGESLALLRQNLNRLRGLDTDRQWGRLEYEMQNVREEDWASAWKRYYTVQKAGERLVVCPSWEEYAPQGKETVVRLDPGMAFGTGTHDSTRLCMQLLEAHMPTGASVLDIGCGSGILAISALLLGAKDAVGVDIDETAVRVAEENACRNGVESRCRFLRGDLAKQVSGTYDMIFANIIADVILNLAPDILRYLTKHGVFIASGIIDTREGDVLAGLGQAGLAVTERRASGGWVALACRRAQ